MQGPSQLARRLRHELRGTRRSIAVDDQRLEATPVCEWFCGRPCIENGPLPPPVQQSDAFAGRAESHTAQGLTRPRRYLNLDAEVPQVGSHVREDRRQRNAVNVTVFTYSLQSQGLDAQCAASGLDQSRPLRRRARGTGCMVLGRAQVRRILMTVVGRGGPQGQTEDGLRIIEVDEGPSKHITPRAVEGAHAKAVAREELEHRVRVGHVVGDEPRRHATSPP
mmetsp:Transcript_34888/g.80817  ORF Transcript_34888/g.80817 Transcript_34888/m.80817 type:complete len:222 (+) Transcript_34888:330-995(+)